MQYLLVSEGKSAAMKTDELIRVLAADRVMPPVSVGGTLGLFLVPGLAVALLIYCSFIGPRPHLVEVLDDPRVLFKISLTGLLVFLSSFFVLGLARPGVRVGKSVHGLLLVPCLLLFGVFIELIDIPEKQWGTVLIGHNSLICLCFIPILSLAPLVSIFAALRQAAPTEPGLAGAGAGLLASGIGAVFYATHCPDDSPLFVAVWYTLAIAIVTTSGALAGRRWLAW